MNYFTLGVLGHVDHGKTTLVKALTGVDTDRLKEEKERGISIALGYASLELPHGQIGVVDAPGHEKFIRTMVAGATGIRAVLLVLDVNEGVKPQTVEHLRIAELLGIEHGVAVITKCDTAPDPELRELAEAELRDCLGATFMADAPFVYTSAETGEGLDELKQVLDDLLVEIPSLRDEGLPCLPVDRVFSISGFGTVVTGTLQRGTLRVGDDVEMVPGNLHAQVRELQAHNDFVTEVAPGHRTAVNLRGVEKQAIRRGDMLAAPGSLQTGRFLSVHLNLLGDADAPLKHRQIVRVLYGTQETYGRMHFLDRDGLEPGDDTCAQIQLEEPAPILFREKFILRAYSPMVTIGGGTLLGVEETRFKRNRPETLTWLETLRAGDAEILLQAALHRNPLVDISKFARIYRYGEAELRDVVKQRKWPLIESGKTALPETVERIQSEIEMVLAETHQSDSAVRGLALDPLTKRLSRDMPDELIEYALVALIEAETLAQTDGLYHRADFTPEGSLSEADQLAAEEIESAFRDGKFQPPGMVEVLHDDKQRMRIYRLLVDKGELVSTYVANKPRTLSNTIVFHRSALEAARDALREQFPDGTAFTPAEARDVLGTTRKYLIPLLECLDRKGITLRREGQRVVR
jgi:selenocysteine-specific elongation factor